jgi:hypothetical protein
MPCLLARDQHRYEQCVILSYIAFPMMFIKYKHMSDLLMTYFHFLRPCRSAYYSLLLVRMLT